MTELQQAGIGITAQGYLTTGNMRTDQRLKRHLDERAEAEFCRVLFDWAAVDHGCLPTRLGVRLRLAKELLVVLGGLGAWIHATPQEFFVTSHQETDSSGGFDFPGFNGPV